MVITMIMVIFTVATVIIMVVITTIAVDLVERALKFKDDAMSYAYGLLRANNCFKDDASSEGKVYGDFEDCDY